MTNTKSIICLLSLLAAAPGWGCAPSYDSYSGCSVNCRYCQPVPLPYSYYNACVCHSDAAERYLTALPQPAMAPEATDVPSAGEVQQETADVRTVRRAPLASAYDSRTPVKLETPLFLR